MAVLEFAARLGKVRSRPSPGAGMVIDWKANGTRDKPFLSLLARMALVLSDRILVAAVRLLILIGPGL